MSIYKDCDIRGVYNEELMDAEAYEIGRAVGTLLHGKTVVVCGDARTSTPALKKQLMKGLRESGANLLDLGLEPTPVFYFAKDILAADGGVMVTASHNPAKYNGFKISLGEQPITTEDIRNIETLVQTKEYTTGEGTLRELDVERDYVYFIKQNIRAGRRSVVVDAGGGATSILAPRIFSEMGYEVFPLFCKYDGQFTQRDPNPAVYENLTALQAEVQRAGADFGVAFDGDGDRVVFVDDTGATVTSERSLCVFMSAYMKDRVSSVVYDLKSSSIVKQTAEQLGSKAIMERSGHAFIKKTFLENKSCLAGEISGHFFFEELGHDDGIFAALKMGEILSERNEKFSQIIARIPTTVITPDIRIAWRYEEQDALLEHIKQFGANYEMSFLDGVRVEFGYGWLLIRKSVTEQGITLRIEADTQENVKKIVSLLLAGVPELAGKNQLLSV